MIWYLKSKNQPFKEITSPYPDAELALNDSAFSWKV